MSVVSTREPHSKCARNCLAQPMSSIGTSGLSQFHQRVSSPTRATLTVRNCPHRGTQRVPCRIDEPRRRVIGGDWFAGARPSGAMKILRLK